MHDDAYIGGRSENDINAFSITISGGKTKQLDIFCRVTGFTSNFLSFIVMELIRFFHGAIRLLFTYSRLRQNFGNVGRATTENSKLEKDKRETRIKLNGLSPCPEQSTIKVRNIG